LNNTLLATKLNIPPARKNLVPRPRLVNRLEYAWQQGQKMTLVSASAGYGKTTLVTEWLRGVSAKSTWLSLDKADNDPARFLAYLIAALGQVDASIGQNTQAMLQSPQPLPPELVLTTLINEIAGAATPFILVLDDYHAIEALPVHQQLDFLVEHQPTQMHLAILTREDPPLPLARLRARGQMAEIRQEELCFSAEECADFLQRVMGLNLTQADIAALERRTEGWIAGLQLAALSMQGLDERGGYTASDFVEAFTGSSHYILDYLIEEVFERQPAEVQEFLLRTSILDRLSGPLCDVVAGRTESAALLARLEHANLFLIPLDPAHTWYRYHHLFAELLRQRLKATPALFAAELHRLASDWFAAEGFLPEAIQHALAAADWDRAADLIKDNSVMMLRRGELITLLNWLKALPDEGICNRPQLCRDYGWALTLTGQLVAAEAYLLRAETAVNEDEALLGSILVDQAAQNSRNHYARMTALTYLGVIQGVYGRLHRAAELCHQVIQLGGQSPTVAPAHIELGALLCEWNDLESAAHHLQTGIEQSQRTTNQLILSDGYRTLALVQLASGEGEAALSTLQKADQLADSRQVTPLARTRNAAGHVQVALAGKDLASAARWAEQVTEPADASAFYPRLNLTPARLLLAQNEKAAAMQKLQELYEIATQAGCGSGTIEVRALQALAAPTPAEALHFLEEALKLAQGEGFLQTFLDKGEPMKALLEKLKPQGGALKEYIRSILAAFGKTGRMPTTQPLIEPLSERELDVLRLVAEGMSNGEIAKRLVVSVGTVKSHVHSIIEKLEVQSRTQAVARARDLKLF
jgi:LuxR family maltose regulon positive regulatory protein